MQLSRFFYVHIKTCFPRLQCYCKICPTTRVAYNVLRVCEAILEFVTQSIRTSAIQDFHIVSYCTSAYALSNVKNMTVSNYSLSSLFPKVFKISHGTSFSNVVIFQEILLNAENTWWTRKDFYTRFHVGTVKWIITIFLSQNRMVATLNEKGCKPFAKTK